MRPLDNWGTRLYTGKPPSTWHSKFSKWLTTGFARFFMMVISMIRHLIILWLTASPGWVGFICYPKYTRRGAQGGQLPWVVGLVQKRFRSLWIFILNIWFRKYHRISGIRSIFAGASWTGKFAGGRYFRHSRCRGLMSSHSPWGGLLKCFEGGFN